MSSSVMNSRLAFGLFELDCQSGELWKAGFRVKLQSQPCKVLIALVEHAGQIVSRDDLQLRVWGRNTNVDFDHSLGTAINKIREALGDSAENPRFVETLARRGYRFIAPVHPVESPVTLVEPATLKEPPAAHADVPAAPADVSFPGSPAAATVASTAPAIPAVSIDQVVAADLRRPHLPGMWVSLVLCLVALAAWAGFHLGMTHAVPVPVAIEQITHSGHLAPSVATM